MLSSKTTWRDGITESEVEKLWRCRGWGNQVCIDAHPTPRWCRAAGLFSWSPGGAWGGSCHIQGKQVQRGPLTQSYSSSEWKNQDLKAGLSFSQEPLTCLESFIDKETEAQRDGKTCPGSEERVNPGVVTLLGSLSVICQNLVFIQFALIKKIFFMSSNAIAHYDSNIW